MKKAFGQIKRGVNKKVLKVPGIEQKVLDATNNDSWGPHGSLLAEIAHASRNHHEYQLTLGVLWKRLSDTGKNWRHVYKALTVLEYLVGHGSERVIEEIKERAYQISTLSSFQYIDSSGRDQGINVRKKAQSLVALVNDKERIAEVREKAAANRERYHNSAVGGMHRPAGGYGDKYDYNYENRDEARSSYGREREYGYTDDDRNSRDGDRYSRDSEERYGRDGNRDDEYRGRSKSVDNYQHGSRGRSSDREQPIEDDGQSSSRGSGARADDHSQDGRGGLERKFSEQNIGAAPPSYEDAVSESRSPVYSERDGGETPQVTPPGAVDSPPAPAEINSVDNKAADFVNGSPPQHVDAFDEFDPRGSFSARAPTAGASVPPTVVSTSAPPASNNAEMDLLGSLSDVFSPNPLAVVTSDPTSFETGGQANTGTAPSFSTSLSSTQPFDDPFGDSPFKAITSADADPSQQQSLGASFQPTPPTSNHDNGHPFGFGEAFAAVPNHELDIQNMQAPLNSSVLPQEQFDTSEGEIDILAGILPPSGPPVSLSPQPNSTVPTSQFPPNGNSYESYHHQAAPTDSNMSGQTPFGQASQHYNMVSHLQNHPEGVKFNNGGFTQQPGYASSANSQHPQYTPGLSQHPTSESFPHQPTSATSSSSQTTYATTPNAPGGQFDGGNFMSQQPYGTSAHIPQQTQSGATAPAHIPQQTQSGAQAYMNNNNVLEDMHQPGSATSSSSQTSYVPTPNVDGGNFMTQQPFGAPSHIPQQTQSGPQAYRTNNNVVEDMHQPGSASSSSSQTPFATTPNAPAGQFDGGNFVTQQPYGAPAHIPQRTHSGPVAAYGNNNNVVENRHQPGPTSSSSAQTPYSNAQNAPAGQFGGGNFMSQQAYGVTQQVHGVSSHMPQRTLSGPAMAHGNSNNQFGDMFAPAGPSSMETSASQPSLTPLTGAIEIAPQTQKKFEPKSAIWADTLSKGLVNFNISGPKTNPLADIGVDFAAINRKEKRLEKPSAAQQQQVTSTINMGKAMGSGTGLGRAGASAMRPPTNSMVGASMPTGMNVGGYGGMMNQNYPMGMNQQHPMGMNQHYPMGMNQNHSMGMNQNYPMGMGMNMNMGGYGQGPQGYQMQPQQGMNMAPPGQQQGMTGAYNPMMGQGGYNPHQQQPYGGGYR